MDNRRLLTFLGLVLLFIGLQNYFFPPQRPQPPAAVAAPPAAGARLTPGAPLPAFTPGSVEIRSPLYRYTFSTRGGALTGAELLRFVSYVQPGSRVQLVPTGVNDLLAHRVAVGADTVDLRALEFRPSAARLELREGGAPQRLQFTAQGPAGVRAEITYTFRADDYLVDVTGRISGVGAGARLITGLGTGLAPHDAPEHGTDRELATVGWNGRRVEWIRYRKFTGVDTLAGPLRWVGIKDRYFLNALVATGATQFERAVTSDVADFPYTVEGKNRVAPRAASFVVMPLGQDGAFAYQAYVGPLEHGRLVAVGHELEEVNPYGYRWLRPIIRPVAQVVLWGLRKMHDEFGLAYGVVLILFGIIVRLVTWPLNARAMRSQMKNMAMQPEMQRRTEEIKKKFPDDLQAQHHATLEMYKEIGFSPFSTMSGCLPLLIPWPVLLTLFFVFQGAIEFRGASFAWLPDLSLKDPIFLLPILLVVTMFGMQWASTKLSGVEQNEQMKMMMYMMPVMMGVVFWWFPSGLNLYYVSQNIASLPQQVLIAKERRRAMEAKKAEDEAKAAVEARLRPTPAKAPRKRR
jgi:YidC/Oxa1 family membrane protein insertase